MRYPAQAFPPYGGGTVLIEEFATAPLRGALSKVKVASAEFRITAQIVQNSDLNRKPLEGLSLSSRSN